MKIDTTSIPTIMKSLEEFSDIDNQTWCGDCDTCIFNIESTHPNQQCIFWYDEDEGVVEKLRWLIEHRNQWRDE